MMTPTEKVARLVVGDPLIDEVKAQGYEVCWEYLTDGSIVVVRDPNPVVHRYVQYVPVKGEEHGQSKQ